MKRLAPIMLGGTGSDVGKSLIATGLCRIFLQDGYHPAPFKAQNMALNSYATPDGREIGRAQAVQAEAAGILCSTDMNPLLLKPSGTHTSQVVLNGIPIGNCDSYSYYKNEGREFLRKEVCNAFIRLSSLYNPIVMEGAGSIAEINLKDTDIVNMSMARFADARVILVADIDRGGVFASAYGSIMLQTPEDRQRIRGIIINKFRGDMRLFEEGRRMMEKICGVPVLGVVPFEDDIHIEEEDSVALSKKHNSLCEGKINIAVVKLNHISNYTDFNTIERCPSVNLFFTDSTRDIANADIIILPGTKSTIADLSEIRESGVADAIIEARLKGKLIIGICGGYQILGQEISDPDGIEGSTQRVEGLGLLPVHTKMNGEKITRQVKFRFLNDDRLCEGYEIHNGRTSLSSEALPLCVYPDGFTDGCVSPDGLCLGSYIHGILDNQSVISHILSLLQGNCAVNDSSFDHHSFKEEQYDMLASHLRKHIDIEQLYDILK